MNQWKSRGYTVSCHTSSSSSLYTCGDADVSFIVITTKQSAGEGTQCNKLQSNPPNSWFSASLEPLSPNRRPLRITFGYTCDLERVTLSFSILPLLLLQDGSSMNYLVSIDPPDDIWDKEIKTILVLSSVMRIRILQLFITCTAARIICLWSTSKGAPTRCIFLLDTALELQFHSIEITFRVPNFAFYTFIITSFIDPKIRQDREADFAIAFPREIHDEVRHHAIVVERGGAYSSNYYGVRSIISREVLGSRFNWCITSCCAPNSGATAASCLLPDHPTRACCEYVCEFVSKTPILHSMTPLATTWYDQLNRSTGRW